LFARTGGARAGECDIRHGSANACKKGLAVAGKALVLW
jgi:hypothetical protein